jgi:predicted 3-demethylubiquinone-9 3-methyltransferase (glyoxalase superfamily)
MASFQRIRNCLWFDGQAEEAANYYVGIFPDSRIVKVARFGEAGREIHGRPAGSVMTVDFELSGQRFLALNGGPQFKFNEAVSLMVYCKDQAEVDHYWEKLTAGGDPAAQQCGWLKDRFGLSWQVVPEAMLDLVSDPTNAGSQRAFTAMMDMRKLDLRALQKAYDGR